MLGSLGGALGGPVGRAVVEIAGNSAHLKADLAKARGETEAAAGSMGQSVSKSSAVMKAAWMAAGIAAVAFSIKAVTAWIAFDDKMTQSVAIMSGVNAEIRADMERTARDVALSTTFSAEQAAEAYFFLASAGLDAAASMEALPLVAQFAQAGMFDLATATDLLTDAQSALGLAVRDDAVANLENMTRIADVLVKANTLANASVEQFATSLTAKAATALRVANKEIEEGAAVLAVFADQGTKGTLAGERLNIILRDLPRAVAKNSDEFDRLGITVTDGNGNLLHMADVVESLTDGLSGMSDVERAAALDAIGLTRASGDAARQLLGTAEMIRFYERALKDAGGTTQTVSEIQLESLKSQLSLAGAALADVGLTLGSTVAPAIRLGAELFRDLAGVVGAAIDPLARFLSLLGEISGTLPIVAAATTAMSARWARSAYVMTVAAGGGRTAALGLRAAFLGLLGPVGWVTAALIGLGKVSGELTGWLLGLEDPLDEAARLAEELGKAMKEGAMSHDEVTEKMEGANRLYELMGSNARITEEAILAAARATEEGARAYDDVTTSAEDAAEAQREAAAAAREAVLAQYELAGGFLGLKGSALSAKQAQIDYRQAQRDVNQLVEDGEKGSKEYRDALRTQANAQLRVVESQLSLGEAVKGFIDDVKSGEVSQQEAVRLVREYGRMAGLSKGEVNGLIGEVKGLIGEYRRVPGEIKTDVKADTSQAESALSRVLGTLRTIAGNWTARLAASVIISETRREVGLASGGIIAGQRGFITQGPAYLVGEGSRQTFAGRGAEAVIPLDQRGIEILAEALRRASTDVPARSGGASGDSKSLAEAIGREVVRAFHRAPHQTVIDSRLVERQAGARRSLVGG